MKKVVLGFMVLFMFLSIVNVSANDDITIYVNEQILQCDIAPYMENGRTMVPMRKIFEALNATVDWEDSTETITATKDNATIILQINNEVMYNNGVAEILDVAPVIVNSSTFVPIRAVSQSLNASVNWLNSTYTVYINSPMAFEYALSSGANPSNGSEAPMPSETKITMYASDGRTIEVFQSEAESYRNVGWYLEPVTLMYAADGRTMYVANSELDAYQGVGWYLSPVTTVYAPDGRSILIYQYELHNYINSGWYRTSAEAKASIVPQTPSYSAPGYNNSPNTNGSRVYRTPSGTRYHFDPDCGGKNSYEVSLQKAKSAGLTPCKKCAS